MEEQHPDYYAILELTIDATPRDINKKYREMARKYHPDKNPDPKAAEHFMRVKKASEFLLSEEKRAAYDAEIRKKLQREQYEAERTQGMDETRKRLKKELEARESAAKTQLHHKRKREKDIASLREEGIRRKEQRASDEFLRHREQLSRQSTGLNQVKVKWRVSQRSHSDDTLFQIFKHYGDIEDVTILAGKANSAIITFVSEASARSSVDAFAASEDWRVSLVGERKTPQKSSIFTHNYNSQQDVMAEEKKTPFATGGNSDALPEVNVNHHKTFESAVLEQMRLAAERQKVLQAQLAGNGESKPQFAAAAAATATSGVKLGENASNGDVAADEAIKSAPSTDAAKSFQARESDILAKLLQHAQKAS